MIQRPKRHWGEMERVAFVTVVEAARRGIISLNGRAPIGSPEYRALSDLLDAVNSAGVFLDLRWTKPGGNQFLEGSGRLRAGLGTRQTAARGQLTPRLQPLLSCSDSQRRDLE